MGNYEGPGLYRHYKGGEYIVFGLALQEDTVSKLTQVGLGEEVTFVVYQPVTAGSMLEGRDEDFWARRLDDFNETVEGPELEIGGPEVVPRFECLEP